MQLTENDADSLPLAGYRVIERSSHAAAAYAGRLLATLGATVILVEPKGGSPLRKAPPWLDDQKEQSALFAYLSVGKRSLVCDLDCPEGQQLLKDQLESADIFIDDTPVAERAGLGLSHENIAASYPSLVHVSLLPFGAYGPKAEWDSEEVNLIHAAGEGFLLPNGFAQELFPDRAPLKIYGHFAEYQGGVYAACAALSALWAVADCGGQYLDVSSQEATLLCGSYAMQRLGDGSLEHRATRKFRYGGVFETKNGYIELLTLEDRQWQGLVQLMGDPEWAHEDWLKDPLERSRRGDEINHHIREWMALHNVEEIVERSQDLGVPTAKYRTPEDVIAGEQEAYRGLFNSAALADVGEADMLLAPFQFLFSPLRFAGGVPPLDEYSGNQSKPEAC